MASSSRQQRIPLPSLVVNGNISISLVPSSSDGENSGEEVKAIEGLPGKYQVTAVLGIPGKQVVAETTELSNLMQSGDSPLVLPSDVQVGIMLDSQQEHVTIFLIPNLRKRLARLRMTFDAQNRDAAEAYAFDLTNPLLSWLSFRYDVGIEVAVYEILEVQSGIRSYSLTLLAEDKTLDLEIGAFSEPAFRAILSAYREGMNSFNPLFQALCFFKVVDACYQIRDSRRKSILAAGGRFDQVTETIPMTFENFSQINFNDFSRFEPYLGKKFTWVRDQFKKNIRNVFAHLDPTHTSYRDVSADTYSDVVRCRMAVPVLRYMARTLIETELKSNLSFQNEGV